ncbi:hypothetical protein Tco_1193480 [Tanacetum coccineum]
MSSKEAKKESTNSDFDDDETHLTDTKEEINHQKKIEEDAKAKAAKHESEVRKEELVDLIGPEVVNKYYNDKLQCDRYYDKMLNRRAESRITNCDILTKKGPITLKQTKGLRSSVQYEDHPASTVLNEPVLAKRESEVRKEEQVDLLGPEVVNKYYNDKLHLCSGSETEEGLCKELQFSLVDNSKLNVVYLLNRSLKHFVSLLEGLQGGKKIALCQKE